MNINNTILFATKCLWIAFVSGVFLMQFSSCGDSTPAPLRITYEERTLIDSFYRRDVQGLRQKMDSLCDLRFDSMVQIAVDSLIVIRKEEERRLRLRGMEGE